MQLPGPRPHVDRLLQSLIKYLDIVPIEADAIHDYSELPSPWLRDIVIAAPGAQLSWRGFMDDRLRIWLFVAEFAIPLSRKLGAPALHVDYYRESGLQDRAFWCVDRHSKWRRCVFKSAQKPARSSTSDEPALTEIDFYRPDSAKNKSTRNG